MSETILNLIVAFVSGVIIGILFFGGLHWTLKKYLSSPYAGVFITASMLLRTGLTVAAFYFVGQGNWQRILLCLIGFLSSRVAVMRFTRASDVKAL